MTIGRDFWIFRVGQFISTIGGPFTNIALAWWVLQETQSPGLVSLAIAPSLLGRTLFLPIFGRLADIYSRKRLLLVSDLIRLGATATLAGIAAEGYFSVAGAAVIGFLDSVGAALFASVEYSILPSLIRDENDTSIAIQTTEFLDSIGTVVGAALAGIAVSTIGVSAAFSVDAATYAIGALATAIISAPAGRGSLSLRSVHQLLEVQPYLTGFRILIKIPVLLGVSLISLVLNFLVAQLAVAIPTFVYQSLHGDAWELGVINAAQGIGSSIGAFIVGFVVAALARHRTIIFGIVLAGITLCAFALIPFITASCFSMILFGIATSLANVPMRAQRMVAIDDQYRSRIDSAMKFLFGLAAPLGALAAGPVIEMFGVSTGILIIGTGVIILAPSMLAVPEYRCFYDGDPIEAKRLFRKMLVDALGDE